MPNPILLLLFLLLLSPPTSAQTSPSDAAAMRDLSKSLSASDTLAWSPTADPCTWPHVTCSGDRVTAVQIGNQSLSGTLPSSLSNLTSLARLELQSNLISGPLPSFKSLSDLQILLLHGNRFSSVPPDFFSGLSSLQSVSLDDNPFDPWELPESLAECSNLVNFSANSVNLTGRFPEVFAGDAFPGLNHVGLAYNFLSGPLPDGLSGSSVTSLWLNNQRGKDGLLSGGIGVVANMTSLVQLWLHSNNFSGPLPDFSGLVSLREVNLRDNKLTGPVPESLVSLKSLKSVILTNNMLQGSVPVFPKEVQHVDLKPESEAFCLPKPGECDPRLSALLSVVESFGYPLRFAESWKGNDPCASWLGVGCDNDGNITVLNFKKMELVGTISPDFTKFPRLEKLILSNNNITGSIPDLLTKLTNLNVLDVSYNSLYGKVPAFKKNILINTDGNVDIGKDKGSGSGPPAPGNDDNVSLPNDHSGKGGGGKSSTALVAMVVGSVLGGVAAIVFVALVIFFICKRKNKFFGRAQSPHTTVIHPQHPHSDDNLVKITVAGSSVNAGAGTTSDTFSATSSARSDVHVVESGNMVISIQVLRNVTNNFSDENILGQGGFGTVYKGELHDGTKIAVKRMESGVMGSTGLSEFQSEIAVLTKVRHRNLVSLLGYCLDGNERLLVYEYMPQGTLSTHLFHWKEEGLKPLEWKKRLSIALDVARGVEYLHTLAHQSFIHRDLKPSNILLGDDMKAKVSDFGLVRLAPDGKCSVVTRLAGTFGYLAPEYAVTGRVTTKADVFSFGVILMELITGRKALDESQPEESVHLVTWFRRMQMDKESFRKAIDPTIDLDEETLANVGTVSELAGHCCAREPYQRPDMGHAVNVLSSLAEMWRPSDPDSEEIYGIDLDMTLPQALKKWQAFEGNSHSDASSSFLASVDNTQTSIPTRPSGFAESFTSADGR